MAGLRGDRHSINALRQETASGQGGRPGARRTAGH